MQYSQTFVQFIAAFLIIIIGLVIGRALGNATKRILKGMEVNNWFRSGLKLKFNAESFFSSLIAYVVYFVAVLLALGQIGVSMYVIKIILLVAVGMAILIALLASKDLLPNFFAGLYLMKTKKIKVGKSIKIRGFEGKIIDFNLIETKIETDKEEEVFIPNSL